jgi:hypothetical protein
VFLLFIWLGWQGHGNLFPKFSKFPTSANFFEIYFLKKIAEYENFRNIRNRFGV